MIDKYFFKRWGVQPEPNMKHLGQYNQCPYCGNSMNTAKQIVGYRPEVKRSGLSGDDDSWKNLLMVELFTVICPNCSMSFTMHADSVTLGMLAETPEYFFKNRSGVMRQFLRAMRSAERRQTSGRSGRRESLIHVHAQSGAAVVLRGSSLWLHCSWGAPPVTEGIGKMVYAAELSVCPNCKPPDPCLRNFHIIGFRAQEFDSRAPNTAPEHVRCGLIVCHCDWCSRPYLIHATAGFLKWLNEFAIKVARGFHCMYIDFDDALANSASSIITKPNLIGRLSDLVPFIEDRLSNLLGFIKRLRAEQPGMAFIVPYQWREGGIQPNDGMRSPILISNLPKKGEGKRITFHTNPAICSSRDCSSLFPVEQCIVGYGRLSPTRTAITVECPKCRLLQKVSGLYQPDLIGNSLEELFPDLEKRKIIQSLIEKCKN